MDVDFLIIGQGLAGSLLTWELIQRGCNVIIVDNGKENASQIAAGLINPITGMRFVKTTDVDVLLPVAKRCYSDLAAFFQHVFYIEKPILRLFRSPQELQNSLKRLTQPGYQDYISEVLPPEATLSNIATPFGYLQQKQTGYLLTQPLLSCLKTFFIEKNCYRTADFNHGDIQLSPLRWQDINARQVIFCEGYQASQNPWFSWLPFQSVKGEILTLQHRTDLPDNIINYGNWLIPLNNQQIRIGATFDRNNLDTLTTESGKRQLLDELKQVSPHLTQATVIKHQANIRPCTLDKLPFLGYHPKHKQLAIFNGFGAKGSLQIPWYSRQFADALLNNTPLPSSIQRYYESYFTA